MKHYCAKASAHYNQLPRCKKYKTVRESRSSLDSHHLYIASGSFTVLLVILSRIICVFFVEKELSRQSSWQTNNAISLIFSEVHIIHIYKSLQETVHCLILDIITRYVAASAVTDTHTHSLTHKTKQLTTRTLPRLN